MTGADLYRCSERGRALAELVAVDIKIEAEPNSRPGEVVLSAREE